MKKVVIGILIFVLAIGIVFPNVLRSKILYSKETLLQSSCSDSEHILNIYSVGTPYFGYGDVKCELELFDKGKSVVTYSFKLMDEDIWAQPDNFDVYWEDSSVVVCVHGSLQNNVYYRVYFDGKVQVW